MNLPQPASRIYIAEPEPQVRRSLAIFVEQGLFLPVVGATDSASDLLEDLRRCRPDILLIAADLINAVGDRLAPSLKAEFPAMKIVLLNSPQSVVEPGLAAGVDAVASKMESPRELAALLDGLDN